MCRVELERREELALSLRPSFGVKRDTTKPEIGRDEVIDPVDLNIEGSCLQYLMELINTNYT